MRARASDPAGESRASEDSHDHHASTPGGHVSTRGNNGRFIKTPKRDRAEKNRVKHKQQRITATRVQENLDAIAMGTMTDLLEQRAAQGEYLAALELKIGAARSPARTADA